MTHVTNDQIQVDNPILASRAGITFLGKYRSSNPNWKRALSNLGRQVDKPAVDRGLERRLADEFTGLDYGRDNRSVTSSEWVEKGLAKFGCPIHTASNGQETNHNVPGYGICSCRMGQRPTPQVHSALRYDIGGSLGSYGTEVRSSGQGNHPERGVRTGTLVGNAGTALASGGTSNSSQVDRGPFETMAYRNAVSAAFGIAGCQEGRRKPYSLARVVETEIHKSHFSGAPYFTRNGDVLDRASDLARKISEGHRGFDPYVAGRRVQRGSAGPKTRLVWMASLPTTIVGTRFSKPVFAGLVRRRPFSFGLRQVEKAALVEEFKSRFKFVYSIDFSGFDSSLPARMIDDAFGIAKSHLDMDDADLDLWDRYKSDFIHSRLITPSGDIYQVHKGIPSGSAFTTIIGSLCNLIALNYILIRVMGRTVGADRVQIQGDDAIIGLNTFVPLSEMGAVAAELGLTLSVEKSLVTGELGESNPPVHYLGYSWKNGQPHKDMHDVIASLVFPERHERRPDGISLLRLFSSMQNSVENYEAFRRVYSNPSIMQAFFECADDMSDLDGITLSVSDLPGSLRLRVAVEGDTDAMPDPTKVVSVGVHGPWS